MTKTFGNIDLTSVIVKSYDNHHDNGSEKIASPVEMASDFFSKAQERYSTTLHQIADKGGDIRDLVMVLDEEMGKIVWGETEHFYSAGFMDGMRYAAYVMKLAENLQSGPVLTAGLHLAETAAAEVDEQ